MMKYRSINILAKNLPAFGGALIAITLVYVVAAAGKLSITTAAEEAGLQIAAPTTRNENSTPRIAILPNSPAIIQPTLPKNETVVLLAKAILLRLGYDVGRLDKRISAKYKAAIFRYQQAHGIATTGALDDLTLRNLTGTDG